MESHIKNRGLTDRVRKLPTPVRKSVPLHYLISKQAQHPQKAIVFERVANALEGMQNKKVLDKIYGKYGYPFSPDQ